MARVGRRSKINPPKENGTGTTEFANLCESRHDSSCKKDPAEAGPVGTLEVTVLVGRIAPAMLADELKSSKTYTHVEGDVYGLRP